tara:strand:+ start:439 stop:681 length:243 start_codon:yes stop_codon:yes gene_type:complete
MRIEELMAGIEITQPVTITPSTTNSRSFNAKRTFNLSKDVCAKLDETSATFGVNNSALVRSILTAVLNGIDKLEINNDRT